MPIGFLVNRLVLAIPTLFGVSVVVFVLLRVVPGDPIAMMIPPGAGQEDIDRLRVLYGLDRSIPEQYGIWLGQALTGDFGTSISLRSDVLGLVLQRLPATLELAALALLIAGALATGLAVLGTASRGRWLEAVVDGVTGTVQAIPDFVWGLLFILALGVLMPVLPISGRLDPRIEIDFVTGFYLIESLARFDLDTAVMLLRHAILPAVALALPLTAVLARLLKSSLSEAMTQDYVQVAKVRGFGPGRLIVREAMRNALIPTVALSSVQVTFLIGGTVLVERIFSYPGIGNMAIGAVINRDLPLIQGLVLTFAVLFIAINLVADLTYAALNPRVRRG